VFSLAINTNFAEKVLSEISSETAKTTVAESVEDSGAVFSLIKNAYAQNTQTRTTTTTTTRGGRDRNSDRRAESRDNESDNSNQQRGDRKFFQPWLNN